MKAVKPLIITVVIGIFLFSILCLLSVKTQVLVPRVAAAAEANVSLQPFLTGLTQPLFVTNAGDGSPSKEIHNNA
jgi:hypothetical protein